jgi:DNA repair protein RecO (recombination protein O)
MRFVTKGLVLRETDIKETDKLLTVLTQTGEKRTVLARRARSKGSRLAASAQLLTYSDMTLFEYRDFTTLDEASTIEQFRGVRDDLALLALGCYFAELAELIAEGDSAAPWLTSLLLNALYALDKLGKDPNLVKPAFEMKLMCLAGFAPLVDECACCGEEEPEEPRLSLREGTIRCAACPSGETGGISMPLCAGSLAALRHIQACDPKTLYSFRLEENALRLLGNTSEAFVMTQLERGFRTLDYYKLLR